MVASRMGHKNATETLRTYLHLWPSSDDKTRNVLERALAGARQVKIEGRQRIGVQHGRLSDEAYGSSTSSRPTGSAAA